MTIKEIQSVLLGYKTSDGYSVVDLRYENQMIVLDEGNHDTNDLVTTTFASKQQLLKYLFDHHRRTR